MKKQLLIASLLACLSLASSCATTPTLTELSSFSWPESQETGVSGALEAWKTGNLVELRKELTPALRAQSVLAQYLWAELAFLDFDWDEAMTRYVDFAQANPKHSYVILALDRLSDMMSQSVYTPPMEKVLALKTVAPYALSKLVAIQSDILVNYAANRSDSNADLKHPTALALTDVRWLGPLSTKVFSQFETTGLDVNAPLPEELDSERGILKSYRYASKLETYFFSNIRGIYQGETGFAVDREAEIQLIIATEGFAELWLDGQLILEKGPDRSLREPQLAVRLKVNAGHHRIRIKYGHLAIMEQQKSPFRIWLAPIDVELSALSTSDALSFSEPSAAPKPMSRIDFDTQVGQFPKADLGDFFKAWAYMELALSDRHFEAFDDMAKWLLDEQKSGAQIDLLLANRYLGDADFSDSARIEETLGQLQSLNKTTPKLTLANYMLAGILKLKAYNNQALKLLDEIQPENADENAALFILKRDIYANLAWHDDAQKALDDAYKAYPKACGLTALYLEQSKIKSHFIDYDKLPDDVQNCPQVINFYHKLEGVDPSTATLNEDRWSSALARLSKRFPDNTSYRINHILALARFDSQAAVDNYLDLLDAQKKRQYPAINPDRILELIDILRAKNATDAANKVLDQSLSLYPSNQALLQLKWRLAGETPLQSLRQNGLAIVKAYLESQPNEQSGTVIILDYAATRYFEDGSSIQLTHEISRVLNKEAKNAKGEVQVPSQATLLELRTIKAKNLETLEPEVIDHKSSTTMPNLEIGDFIEQEYLTYSDANATDNPRVFSDAGFFFGIYAIPIARSEYVFEYPKDWKVMPSYYSSPDFDVSPKCQPQGDYIQCRSLALNTPPYVVEVSSAAITDVIPNIQYSQGYDWPYVLDILHNRISAQVRVSPTVERYLEQIKLDPNANTRTRAMAIYEHVLKDIGEADQSHFESTASQSINSYSGSRMATLKALYDAAGIPSYVALIEHISTPKHNPQPNRELLNYYVPILVVDDVNGPAYLQIHESFYPYDYLDPGFQGRQLVPVDSSRAPLTSRIESFEERVSKIETEFLIAADGSAAAKGNEILQSSRALTMRAVGNRTENDEESLYRIIEGSISRSFGRVNLENFKIENLDQKQSPLKVKYDYEISKIASTQDQNLSLDVKAISYLMTNRYAPQAQRKTPLVLESDLVVERTVRFILPDTFAWSQDIMRAPIELKTPFGLYKRTTTMDAKTLEIVEIIDMQPQRIEAPQYQDFRSFCQSIDEAQRNLLIAVPKED